VITRPSSRSTSIALRTLSRLMPCSWVRLDSDGRGIPGAMLIAEDVEQLRVLIRDDYFANPVTRTGRPRVSIATHLLEGDAR
jgi:hypothetical protein